jgi:hypothetical protein
MTMRYPAAALLVLSCAASAAETVLSDLRFGLGVASVPDRRTGRITAEDNPAPPDFVVGGQVSENYSSTVGTAVSISATYGRLSPIGLVWGGELRMIDATMELETFSVGSFQATAQDLRDATGNRVPRMQYSQDGVIAHLGIGWAINQTVHVELLALAGLDRIAWDSPAINATDPNDVIVATAKGNGITTGTRAGAFWTKPSGWQVGVIAEWTQTQADLDLSYTTNKRAYDFNDRAFALRGTFGKRF